MKVILKNFSEIEKAHKESGSLYSLSQNYSITYVNFLKENSGKEFDVTDQFLIKFCFNKSKKAFLINPVSHINVIYENHYIIPDEYKSVINEYTEMCRTLNIESLDEYGNNKKLMCKYKGTHYKFNYCSSPTENCQLSSFMGFCEPLSQYNPKILKHILYVLSIVGKIKNLSFFDINLKYKDLLLAGDFNILNSFDYISSNGSQMFCGIIQLNK